MSSLPNRKVVYENELVNDEELIKELGDFLDRFPDAHKYIKRERRSIKIENYVGVLGTKKFEIDVLPKIWKKYRTSEKENYKTSKENFLNLFSYAVFEPEFFEPYLFLLQKKEVTGLKEFITLLYAYSLLGSLKKGVFRTYIKEDEVSKFLRGKLLVKEHMRRIDKSKFDVRRRDFTANNELNQSFYYGSEQFGKNMSYSEANELLLKESAVFKSENVESNRPNGSNVTFNRMNERFEIPYNYLKLLLENRSPSPGGNRKEMMFLYNMNDLFEKFLYHFLYRNRKAIFENYEIPTIRYQKGEVNFIVDLNKDETFYQTRPDIQIIFSDRMLILDTKNKVLDKIPPKGLELKDLNQMHTYSETYHADSVLFYPSPETKHDLYGPYRFHGKSKYDLWISSLNLDFLDRNWEKRMITNLKGDFNAVLGKEASLTS